MSTQPATGAVGTASAVAASRKVAIIGAGPSGLCAAKSALAVGLWPVVFEAADTIGGVWTHRMTTWPAMRINSSCYTTSFIDFEWRRGGPLFPQVRDMQRYLRAYARAHSLEQHVRLCTRVERVWRDHAAAKWSLTFRCGSSLASHQRQRPLSGAGSFDDSTTEQFDHLIVASGLNNKPRVPSIPNASSFGGHILHSSAYDAHAQLFADRRRSVRRVLVVGHSSSAVQICCDIAERHPHLHVLNVFQRPYLIVPLLSRVRRRLADTDQLDIASRIDAAAPDNSEDDSEDDERALSDRDESAARCWQVLPCDFLLFTRRASLVLGGDERHSSVDQRRRQLLDGYSLLCREQFDRTRCSHPALFIDLLSANASDDGGGGDELGVAISQHYLQHVRDNKISVQRARIARFEKNGVRLGDESFAAADVVLFATSYRLGLDFLDESVRQVLALDEANFYKEPMLLYEDTWHPDLGSAAFVGLKRGAYFAGAELQVGRLLLTASRRTFPQLETLFSL